MLHFPSLSGSSVYSFVPSIFGDFSGSLQGILSPKLYRYKHTFRSRHFVASLHTYRPIPSNFLYTFNSLLRDIGWPIISHTQFQLLTRSLSTNQISRRPRYSADDLIGQFFSLQRVRGVHTNSSNESNVIKLEDRANDYPTDASAQEQYLKMVLEMDPHYVIRRYETGKFAINNSIRRIYQEALVLSGQFNSSPKSSQTTETKLIKGTAEAPLVVDITQKKHKWLRDLGKIFLYLFIATYFLHTIDNSFKGALPHMKKTGFAQDIGDKKYKFSDVQGAFEAKEELREVVEFLKTPEKFQRLGAKMPKGVLLVGKPGTGKTLLARAVAGEANVPFFFTSGSEFDEMYVGVGAARLRNLFQTAKNSKPCVIFIDELDAVGGARIATDVHPYARMTLNQLLVELDGYKENEEVVVIGATNFPESLDKALVRPGRFDLKINIPIPDLKARYDILKLYLDKVKCDPNLNIESLARSTLGMTGADLANLVNQAAIQGSVKGREFVIREDLDMAEDKIRMGPERRSLEIREKNKEVIAYHEAGHALVSLYTEGSMAIRKATIIPRGGSLGMVSFFPDKDELGWTKKQMMAQLDVAMGGRAAEEIIFGKKEVTAGASSDMKGATGLAVAMVAQYGMSDKLGPIYIENPNKIGGELRKVVDTEVRRLITESLTRAQSILNEHSREHQYLAKALLKYETLDLDEINTVIRGEKLKRPI